MTQIAGCNSLQSTIFNFQTTNTFCVFSVSLPQLALNLCRVNLAQKLQIVTIVSWENILHTSPSLLVFHSFHLNHNLFFLLLATPYSSPHILDTLVLTISIFPSLPFQIIQQKLTSRSPYMGTHTIFYCSGVIHFGLTSQRGLTSLWTSGTSCSRLG